ARGGRSSLELLDALPVLDATTRVRGRSRFIGSFEGHMNTRRTFLQTALAAGGAALAAPAATAIEPIRRNARPQIRLSLAAYSFPQSLNLKRQPKPAMTL